MFNSDDRSWARDCPAQGLTFFLCQLREPSWMTFLFHERQVKQFEDRSVVSKQTTRMSAGGGPTSLGFLINCIWPCTSYTRIHMRAHSITPLRAILHLLPKGDRTEMLLGSIFFHNSGQAQKRLLGKDRALPWKYGPGLGRRWMHNANRTLVILKARMLSNTTGLGSERT